MPNYKRLDFFDKDTIPWTGQFALHELYKTLLGLRKRNPALRGGDPTATTHRLRTAVLEDRCFAFARRKEKHGGRDRDEVLVVLNLSGEQLSLPAAELLLSGSFIDVFTGQAVELAAGKIISVPPWGFGVWEKK